MTAIRTPFRSMLVVPMLGAALMALQACDAQSAPDPAPAQSVQENPAPAASIPAECPTLLASGRPVFPLEKWEQEYFDISRYADFPPDDRPLLQRANVESSRCRGESGNDPETLRACNRRHCVMLELEARGWCWGGGDSGATDHWVRCSEIPEDPPMERELPFSEEQISEIDRDFHSGESRPDSPGGTERPKALD